MSKCLQALRDAEAEEIGEYFHSCYKTSVGKIKSTCSNYLRSQKTSKCASHTIAHKYSVLPSARKSTTLINQMCLTCQSDSNSTPART